MARKFNTNIENVLRGVADTLNGALVGVRVDTMEAMTEGINDYPLLHVYPELIEGDISSEGTNRSTFRGGVQQVQLIINVDVFARQRSHMAEDMVALVAISDNVVSCLQDQETKPFFGVEGLQAFQWRGERVTFEYADTAFVGMRFQLTFRIF